MTTWSPDQTPDQWSAATMAARVPQTVTMRAAAESATTHYAWSAEPPEPAVPLPVEQSHRRFVRSRVPTLLGGGLVVAAAAGFFGALHGGQSTAVDTTTHTAAAPAATTAASPAPQTAATPQAPAPTPAAHPKQSAARRPVMASHESSTAVSQQSPPSPKHDSVSTPSSWNRNFLYWFTHRHDHDGRWMHDFGHSK